MIRRSGSTTRLVDKAVQELFEKGEIYVPSDAQAKKLLSKNGSRGLTNEKYGQLVKFIDYIGSNDAFAQNHFFSILMERLGREHQGHQFIYTIRTGHLKLQK